MTKYQIRRIVFFTSLIALVVTGAVGITKLDIQPPGPVTPYVLDGGEFTNFNDAITDQYNVVIVLFWHKDCPYCLDQLEILQDFLYASPYNDVGVLAINIGNSEKQVRKIVEERNLTYPQVYGIPRGELGISSFPYMTIISRNERNQWETVYEMTGLKDLETLIEMFTPQEEPNE